MRGLERRDWRFPFTRRLELSGALYGDIGWSGGGALLKTTSPIRTREPFVDWATRVVVKLKTRISPVCGGECGLR